MSNENKNAKRRLMIWPRKKKKMSHRSSNDVDVGVDFFFFSLGFPIFSGVMRNFQYFYFFLIIFTKTTSLLQCEKKKAPVTL